MPQPTPKLPRGRNGGRPVSVGATARITVTLTPADVAVLQSLSPNLSEAVRLLIAAHRAPLMLVDTGV